MRPWPNLVAVLVLHLFTSCCQGAWVRDAWVRKYPCAPLRPDLPAPDKPFWIDSLRGKLETVDGSTQLSLSILGVHNTSMFGCLDLDVARFEKALGLEVLGYPVGRLGQFGVTCPLPIDDSLTPFDGYRFSTFDVIYLLNHTHQLQSLVTEFRFHHVENGHELDCAVAKITPVIGTTASAALTYLPAGIMALVGVASWQTHVGELATNPLFEYGSAMASRSLVWETIVDVADYLRHLQFVFLSASLSIDYPGFYQPVVSKIAWSSLLFWRGPIHHGFTHQSVQQGMYISNASYGLDYMAQVLGFPRVPDSMLNAFVNLLLIASVLFFILAVWYLLTSRQGQGTPWRSLLQMAGGMAGGAVLSLFSFPLVTYMSDDMIFIGYLPNYRIALAVMTLLVLVCANYIITHRFGNNRQLKRASHAESSRGCPMSLDCSRLWTYTSYYLPQSIPLLQAIVIGALQDWGTAQLLVLTSSEAVFLLHATLQRSVKCKFLCSKTVWCSVVRLVTTSSLSIAVITAASEATKQWVGYAMLCLHGMVILPGFSSHAIWQLYRANKKEGHLSQEAYLIDSHSSHSNEQTLNLDDIGSHFVRMNRQRQRDETPDMPDERLRSLRNYPRPALKTSPAPLQDAKQAPALPPAATDADHQLDFSPFYRKPRSRNATPYSRPDSSRQSSRSTVPSPTPTNESDPEPGPYFQPERQSQETLDALLEASLPPDVDYSVRESDRFYGRPVSGSANPLVTPGAAGRPIHQDWRQMIPEIFKHQKKEKGFQVVRPPRPPQ
ncbi:hypothetical protein J3459_009873 [Metarhizium acridum]|nr:hypothetical protein J3459_009873 [Metarhizium acridum]